MELQVLFYEVIRTYDCKVLAGFRSEAEQHAAYVKLNSRVDWPNSKHNQNPSMAADVAPYPIDFNNKDVKNLVRYYHFAGFVLGTAERLKAEGKMTYSVRYGGDWDRDHDFKDQSFDDLVHYELV